MKNEINTDSGKLDLDAIDLKLLRLLQADASRSNQELAEQVHVSAPTCLRRVKRLHQLGLIERQVAILQPDRLKAITGEGLMAIAEITLTEQTEEMLAAFEARLVQEHAVQQCYRTSPGPDLVAILAVQDMSAYRQLAQRLFTQESCVRNVRVFFVTARAKFSAALPWL